MVQLDLLPSLSPATLNVNSGLCLQWNQHSVPKYDPINTSSFCIWSFWTIERNFSCLRWYVARKSECTAQCGVGYRSLEIYCAKISHTEGKTQKVDDRYCSGQRKPDDKEGCHGDCNPGGWEYSPWSEVWLLWDTLVFLCEHRPDFCLSLSQSCLHMYCRLLMLKRLLCSAPWAVAGAPVAEGRSVERHLWLAVMKANAVKGTNWPSNPAMNSFVHNGRQATGLRWVKPFYCILFDSFSDLWWL